MSYETVAAVSQSAVLILFMTLFFIVVGYAFWPKNRERFEQSQRTALDLDAGRNSGGRK
jgi:cytochrome c oxidase cbb3-type subunit 4